MSIHVAVIDFNLWSKSKTTRKNDFIVAFYLNQTLYKIYCQSCWQNTI